MKSTIIQNPGVDMVFGGQQEQRLIEKKILGGSANTTASKKSLLASNNRVAIITMHSDSVWARRVVKGCISSVCNTLMPSEPPLFDVYSAEASVDKLRTDVLDFIYAHAKEYGVIVTIGEWTSKHVFDYRQQAQHSIPQIFLSVRDPIGLGLVESLTDTSGTVTGVVSTVDDFNWQVSKALMMKPSTKRVVVPFTPEYEQPGMREDLQALYLACTARGLEFVVVEINTTESLEDQLRTSLQGADMMWVMRDQYLQISTKLLVNVCNELEVTMFATELASVFQGAAMGAGDSGTVVGAYGGHLVLALLSGEYAADALSVYIIEHPPVLRVNPKTMGLQGWHPTEEQRILIQEVIPLGWE